jgi:anhydro-N-acetylmuramic acid kinase
MQKYLVIGLMSGTSLDGVDLAYTEFVFDKGSWSFNLLAAKSYEYPTSWRLKLNNAMQLDGLGIHLLDIELAEYFSELINGFRKEFSIENLDFISSHGHTIFNQPEKKLSLQIGAGQILASNCGVEVVCDFRKQDVAMGGQGAPLVPIGDKHLFSSYNYCLNIGGIANVSFDVNGKRIAYDVCPANMVLNHYAELLNKRYDEDGAIAESGKCDVGLLHQLNNLNYYTLPTPKSLGKEMIYAEVIPLIESYDISIADKLNTFCEHIAMQIASNVNYPIPNTHYSLLITGGGAYHQHLINRIKHHTPAEIIIPSKEIIEFKEAIIFAFLGVLRMRGENNCLASVTGAKEDHCSGVIFNMLIC